MFWRKSERTTAESLDEKWAISLGAIYTAESGAFDVLDARREIYVQDGLSDEEIESRTANDIADLFLNLSTPNGRGFGIKKIYRKVVKESWDITCAQDGMESLEWLKREGHQANYELLVMAGRHLEEKGRIDYSFFTEGDNELSDGDKSAIESEVHFVRTHCLPLGDCGIRGWDIARIVNLARLLYLAGYIKAKEAWGIIVPVKVIAQNTFESWEHYANSFILGRILWNGESDDSFDDALERLLNHPFSPWSACRWSQ